ncbi:hypothetical protein H4582DRAFT_2062413 [Lactarius indigo]|nr:hypothetical protein H4582DRAFT_2062413 [Lactarius indigo]
MTSPDHHRSRQSGTNPTGGAVMTSGETRGARICEREEVRPGKCSVTDVSWRRFRYRPLTELWTKVCALEFPGFGADDGASRTRRPAETNSNTRRVVQAVEGVSVCCVNVCEVPEQEKKLAVDRPKGALPLTRRCRIGKSTVFTLAPRLTPARRQADSAFEKKRFLARHSRSHIESLADVPLCSLHRNLDVTVLAPIARRTPRGLLKNSTGVVLICDKITIRDAPNLAPFVSATHFPPSTRLTRTRKSRELAPYRIAITENGTSLKFATAAVAGAVERSRAVSRVLCNNMSRHDSERAAGNLKIHNHARCSTLVVPCVVNAAQKPTMNNADLEWSGESLDAKALAVVATSALGQLKEKFENWRVRTYFVAEVVPEEILPPLAQSSSGDAPDADVASGNGTQETSVPGRRVTQYWWQLFAPKPVVRRGGLPSNHGPRPRPLSSMPHAVSFALPPAPGGLGRCEPPVNSRDVKRLAGTGQTTPEADENSSRDVRSAEL